MGGTTGEDSGAFGESVMMGSGVMRAGQSESSARKYMIFQRIRKWQRMR